MDKCNLMTNEINLLRHTIRGDSITPTAERIREIADFKPPNDKKQVQKFLGTVNYIGGHLPHIATLQAPLTELTGNAPRKWTATQQQAFEHMLYACKCYLLLTWSRREVGHG